MSKTVPVLFSLAFSVAVRAQIPVPPVAGQRLLPGDLIAVTVFQTPELTTSARLDPAGAIAMPVAGSLILAGDTAAAAASAIAARLHGYLRDPQVEVVVTEFAPQPVTVLGAVRNPGVFSLRLFPDLPAVVAAAGGVAAASGDRLTVTHADGAVVALPLEALVAGADASASNPALPALAVGDVVRVTAATSIYVAGEVNKPGQLAMPATGLTLVEALGMAGGLQRNGNAARVRVVRTSDAGSVSVEAVDVARIHHGLAPDVALRPLDLVYVPASAERATLFRGMETALGVGTTLLTGLIIFH